MTEQEAMAVKSGEVLKQTDGTLWIARRVVLAGLDRDRLDYIEIQNAAGNGRMSWMDCDLFELV